jgi:hypothetical protein
MILEGLMAPHMSQQKPEEDHMIPQGPEEGHKLQLELLASGKQQQVLLESRRFGEEVLAPHIHLQGQQLGCHKFPKVPLAPPPVPKGNHSLLLALQLALQDFHKLV